MEFVIYFLECDKVETFVSIIELLKDVLTMTAMLIRFLKLKIHEWPVHKHSQVQGYRVTFKRANITLDELHLTITVKWPTGDDSAVAK